MKAQSSTKGATSLKGSMKRVTAWAKKNPALAALLVGGVVLLAVITMRKSSGIATAQADGFGTDGDLDEDIMGGLGGLGLESYEPPPLSDFIIPEFFMPEVPPLYTEPAYTYWYPEDEVVQAGTVYPDEDTSDREYYLGRAHELEALAGEQTNPTLRGLIADAARLTGLASLSEEEWEIWERKQREATERQRGEGQRVAQQSTQTTTQTRKFAGLQWLTDQLKRVLTPATPRAPLPSSVTQRKYTLPSTYAPKTPSTPLIGPVTKPADYDTFTGQFAYFQSIVDSRQSQPAVTTRVGGLQEN